MTRPPGKTARAGGIFLTLGVLGGLVVGSLLGESSIGILVGLGLGIAALAATSFRR